MSIYSYTVIQYADWIVLVVIMVCELGCGFTFQLFFLIIDTYDHLHTK